MPTERDPDQPYCGNCGYQLSGVTEAARCPECGRPLVEVLMRGGQWGRRYRSESTLFGVPVIDVAYGPAPGERIGRPRGIIALGDAPIGVLAIGGFSRGVVAIGGCSIGLFTCGGISIGLLAALGGVAIGALAVGGLALGILVSGGFAAGYVASGGVALGYYAVGGAPIGRFTAGGTGTNSAEAIDMIKSLAWFFGPGRGAQIIMQPFLAVIALILAGAAGAGLLAVIGSIRSRGGGDNPYASSSSEPEG